MVSLLFLSVLKIHEILYIQNKNKKDKRQKLINVIRNYVNIYYIQLQPK